MTDQAPAATPAATQRWLTRSEICERLRISRSTSYRLLPPPVRFGPRTVRWALAVVENLERQAEATR